MARFYYSRTKKIVEIPDDRAHLYEGRRRYERLDEPDAVPEGSVAEIIAWAGADPQRRRAALVAERLGKARKSLIKALS
jgi:hypothetical protein